MKFRHIIVPVLLLLAAASAFAIACLLVRHFSGDQLDRMRSSLQVLVFVFTASAGLLALIIYWGSVAAEMEQKQWEKLQYLEKSFQEFRSCNLDVIQAFDWPHILRNQYLPLCQKSIEYDNADDVTQTSLLSSDELSRVRDIDDFLEYFENLYFAISRKLMKVQDMAIFLQYYILLLGNAYCNPEDTRLKRYVDEYYYNIKTLLDQFAAHLKKHPEIYKKSAFPYYPEMQKNKGTEPHSDKAH